LATQAREAAALAASQAAEAAAHEAALKAEQEARDAEFAAGKNLIYDRRGFHLHVMLSP
jgi:hypothetical protein